MRPGEGDEPLSGVRIETVCFDLDGTLLRDDNMPEIIAGVAGMLVARHPWLSFDEVVRANERHWRTTWAEYEVPWCRGEVSLSEGLTSIWRATLADLGITDAETTAAANHEQERLERESWRLYDEAVEVLEALRARGIRIAVITNGPSDFQRDKLEAVGLSGAFDAIVASGDRGIEKPRPEIFAHALDLVGGTPERSLHVGDSRSADVAGARAAGLTAVWLDRSGTAGSDAAPGADAVVTDLRELLSLLG